MCGQLISTKKAKPCLLSNLSLTIPDIRYIRGALRLTPQLPTTRGGIFFVVRSSILFLVDVSVAVYYLAWVRPVGEKWLVIVFAPLPSVSLIKALVLLVGFTCTYGW